MPTAQDDHIGRQPGGSFLYPATDDPAWMERLWYTAHPVPGGDMILNIGFGFHPGRNVLDAHAGIATGGTQHNLRLSRHLDGDPRAQLGPLRLEVVEPMKRHRLMLEPNGSGLSFDLEFLGRFNAHEEKHHSAHEGDRVTQDLSRYHQAGRFSGWIEVDGRRIEVDPTRWWGQRDHSRGIRTMLRTDETSPPMTVFPPHQLHWAIAQFEDSALHLFLMDRAPGDYLYLSGEQTAPLGQAAGQGRLLQRAETDIVWDEGEAGRQTAHSITARLAFADGTSRTIEARPLPARFFLKGGLFGGLDGWFPGADKGACHIEHDIWDLNDPVIRRKARTFSDTVFAFRDGDRTGYGIFEYWVTAGYPRYAEVQDRPAP